MGNAARGRKPAAARPPTPAEAAAAKIKDGLNRAQRRAGAQEQAIEASTVFTMEHTGEELAFLRLLLTNANVQPSNLKVICGRVQGQIEELIGPLPVS